MCRDCSHFLSFHPCNFDSSITYQKSIYHFFELLLQTKTPPISQILSSMVFLVLFWTAFTDLGLGPDSVGTGHWPLCLFVCVSFFFFCIFISGYVCYGLSWPQSTLSFSVQSNYRIVRYRRVAATCRKSKLETRRQSVSLTVWRYTNSIIITARCTLVQSAVLRLHVVCLSVCLSVCNVGEL